MINSASTVIDRKEQPIEQGSSELEKEKSSIMEDNRSESSSKEGVKVEDILRASGAQLSPRHPCFEYLKKQGLDLGITKDFKRFAVDPSPLGGRRWYLVVSVLGRIAEFLVDTGASHSFISSKLYNSLPGRTESFASKIQACSADGSQMQTYGRTFVPLEVGKKENLFSYYSRYS